MNTNDNLNENLQRLGRKVAMSVFGIGVGLLLAELFIDRYGEIKIEDVLFFPAVFSFLVSIFIVVIAIGVRQVLMRGEDYYKDGGDNDAE